MSSCESGLEPLNLDALSEVGGGIAPLALAAAAVTSPGFIKFTTAVSLIALGMDLATELID